MRIPTLSDAVLHLRPKNTRLLLLRAFLLGALAFYVPACGPDAADREYFAALRGDEDGSTFEQRITHLDRAITLEPERPRYWESRAVLRIDRRDFIAARSDLDRAIELGDRPYLRFLRGLALCQSGDCGAALSDFDRAIGQQPQNAQFYRGRALGLVTVGRPADALADAEELVRLDPQTGRSCFARGAALAGLGRHDEAIADFSEALRRMPELIYPLPARAASYDAIGKTARAKADRDEANRKLQSGSACAYCTDPFRY